MASSQRQPIALISLCHDPVADLASGKFQDAANAVRQVGKALAKLGWQVDLFTRKTHPDQSKIVHHSPHCRTIRLEAGSPEPIAPEHLLKHLPQFVKAFQSFQTKEGTNYPLVHAQDWLSGWVGLRLKQHHNIQLVYLGSHSEECYVNGAAFAPETKQASLIDTQFATELELRQKADQVVLPAPEQSWHFATQGNGSTLFNPKSESKTKLGFNSGEQLVLYIGAIRPEKGAETLLQAFKLYLDRLGEQQIEGFLHSHSHSVRLLIVSEDDNQQNRSMLEQWIDQFGLRQQVQVVESVTPDQRSLYFLAADVCVIPSAYEAFGSVALEAIVRGTPVVASRVGGLTFTVAPEETGLLVDPHHPVAFAEAIDRVLSDELWTRRLKRHAMGQIDPSLSWTIAAAQLSDLYRRLLAQTISRQPLCNRQTPYILHNTGPVPMHTLYQPNDNVNVAQGTYAVSA